MDAQWYSSDEILRLYVFYLMKNKQMKIKRLLLTLSTSSQLFSQSQVGQTHAERDQEGQTHAERDRTRPSEKRVSFEKIFRPLTSDHPRRSGYTEVLTITCPDTSTILLLFFFGVEEYWKSEMR